MSALDLWITMYGPLGNSTRRLGDLDKETLVALLAGQLRWEWADRDDNQ